MTIEIPTQSPVPPQGMQAEAMALGFAQCVEAQQRTFYATPIGWLLVAWLCYGMVPPADVLRWAGCFFLAWTVNLLTLRHIAKTGPDIRRHRFALTATVVLDGVCWGLMARMLMTHNARLDAWLLIVLCGALAVNVPTYITYPRAFRLLTGAMWLTTAVSVATRWSGIDAAIQLLTGLLVYCGLLIYTIGPISTRVVEGIRLRLENGALAERLQQHLDHAKHLASTDALTGQMNRRALDQALDQLIVEGDRRGAVFSLLMLDIDYFKKINDTHGHSVGDQALQAVARRIAAPLRKGDLCARFGGEEFVALLPAADLDQACEVAERIRQAVAQAALETEPPIPATVSIGVATYCAGMSAEALLAVADREVYVAKRNGRNQVCADQGG
ncbi:diguanylate cyclase [Duganella sp. BuS-21]|uniref:GGDEF domain-containing protein n=1 Tax=Duganella sp. BuS-21 TaxID=2943848 RepID=UPI0035A58B90